MLDHQIIEILKSFKEEELKSFRNFIISPYFNTSETVVKLYDALLGFYPGFPSEDLSKERLYTEIKPGMKYNDSTIRNLLADLLKLAENFLNQANWEKKNNELKTNLLSELTSRNHPKLFWKNVKNIEMTLDLNTNLDSERFLDRYRVESFKHDNHNYISGGSDINKKTKNLLDAGKYLVSFFIMDIIKIYDNLIQHCANFKINYKDSLFYKAISKINIQEALEILKDSDDNNNFIYKIYYYAYKALITLDDEYYNLLKEEINNNIEKLSSDEIQFLYPRLLNYCFVKSVQGDERYDEELFQHYETMLLYEYYKTDNNSYLPVSLFRNVLILGLKLKKLDRLNFIVNTYLNKLHPSQQENLYNYTYANIYFASGEYVKSLEYMMKVDYDHYAFSFDMKSLLLKIYYELDYHESSLSLVDCYMHSIKRSKMMNDSRKAYHTNFVQYVNKFLKLRMKPNAENAEFLMNEISSKNDVLNKEWLLNKAEELTKEYRKAI